MLKLLILSMFTAATIAAPESADDHQIRIKGERYQDKVDEALQKEEKQYNEGAIWYLKKDCKEIRNKIIAGFMKANDLDNSSTNVKSFHIFAMKKELEAISWMESHYFPKNHELIKKVEKAHEKFVISREGQRMPEKFIKGYVGAAKYTFDRASYKIYRVLIETAERKYTVELTGYAQGMTDALKN